MEVSLLLIVTVLINLVILLSKCAAGSAPGDEHRLCTTGPHTKTYPNTQEVLMDSYNYFTLVSGFYPPPVWVSKTVSGNGWTEITGGGICKHHIHTCDYRIGQTVDNWLFTQYIHFFEANEVFVEITYNFAECQMASTCADSLIQLYFYNISAAYSIPFQRTNKENYQLIETLTQPFNNLEDQTETVSIEKPRGSMGFYLAFRDRGTCGIIKQVRVYYKVCPAKHVGLAAYPVLPLPVQGSLIETIGRAFCAPFSVIHNSEYKAYGDGRCVYNARCECRLGYEEVSMTHGDVSFATCRVCPQGTYRSESDISCQTCPANTETTGVGVSECPCIENYYRKYIDEGPNIPCTSPPSACQNITVDTSSSYNQITVTWNRPEVTGRDDFYYNIFHVDSCAEEPGQLIQHNVSPYLDKGNEVSYTVSGLNPFTSYTIRVTVHNGVSDQDPEGEENRMCEITSETIPSQDQPTFFNIVSGLAVWNATDSDQYKIRWTEDSSPASNATHMVYYTLDENRGYNAQVRTVNKDGEERWCRSLTIQFKDSIDVDECTTGTHNCDHNCHNTHGSYYCSCRQGFTLSSDGHSCIAQSPCKSTELLINTGRSGQTFRDPCAAAIHQIRIHHGAIIGSIQITYILNNGSQYAAPRYGSKGDETVVDFQQGEQIVAVMGGLSAGDRLTQFKFITVTPDGSHRVHGPYGNAAITMNRYFVVNANVVSIYGKARRHIEAIGFTYRYN